MLLQLNLSSTIFYSVMLIISEGGFLERALEGPFSPGLAGRMLSYADEEPPSPTTNGLYDTPPYSVSHSPTSQIADDGVVTITLHPDEDGKYGFNVKGRMTTCKFGCIFKNSLYLYILFNFE